MYKLCIGIIACLKTPPAAIPQYRVYIAQRGIATQKKAVEVISMRVTTFSRFAWTMGRWPGYQAFPHQSAHQKKDAHPSSSQLSSPEDRPAHQLHQSAHPQTTSHWYLSLPN